MKRRECLFFRKLPWELILTTIIGITSAYIAYKANQLSNVQTLVARNSALPTVEVTQSVQESTYENIGHSSIIDISNLAGKMDNYTSEIVSFLSCYYSADGYSYAALEIPIESYYFLSVHTGTVYGLIERKDSVGNYAQLRDIENQIRLSNSEATEAKIINVFVNSFLKIGYTDLLGDRQSQYYYIAPQTVKTIEPEWGQAQIERHRALSERLLYIPTSTIDEIQIDDIIRIIEGILSIPEDEYSLSEILEDKELFKIDSNLISALLGGLLSIIGGVIAFLFENRKKTKHCANILYYDLQSIEVYLTGGPYNVNLRYFESWQNTLCECSFLSKELVGLVYTIYDNAYNYNFLYNNLKYASDPSNEAIEVSLNKLRNIVFEPFSSEKEKRKYQKQYNELLKALEKYK